MQDSHVWLFRNVVESFTIIEDKWLRLVYISSSKAKCVLSIRSDERLFRLGFFLVSIHDLFSKMDVTGLTNERQRSIALWGRFASDHLLHLICSWYQRGVWISLIFSIDFKLIQYLDHHWDITGLLSVQTVLTPINVMYNYITWCIGLSIVYLSNKGPAVIWAGCSRSLMGFHFPFGAECIPAFMSSLQ